MEAIAPWHIAVIAIAALVLFFGWRRLPDAARKIGRSLRVIKDESRGLAETRLDVQDTLRVATEETRGAVAAATGRTRSAGRFFSR